MAEHGRQGASRLATALSDVVEGVRVVSHNSLALLGLCGAVVIALLVGSPQWRHQAEDRALTWLMDRANARVAAAEVVVEEDPANPGYYSSKFFLRPHYQLEGLTVSLRLVSTLPSQKK